MAGATSGIKVSFDDSQLQHALNVLKIMGGDMTAAMLEISEYLHERTRDHFDNEEDPDGTPWQTLSAETIERKEKKGISVNKILHGETLHLRDTIFSFSSDDEAGISTGPGTDAYAATHQFGDPDRDIPERRYFGIGDVDEIEILGIIQEHLKQTR